jgi:hypothetical protein
MGKSEDNAASNRTCPYDNNFRGFQFAQSQGDERV